MRELRLHEAFGREPGRARVHRWSADTQVRAADQLPGISEDKHADMGVQCH